MHYAESGVQVGVLPEGACVRAGLFQFHLEIHYTRLQLLVSHGKTHVSESRRIKRELAIVRLSRQRIISTEILIGPVFSLPGHQTHTVGR